jgi:DNA-binding CsgD family transcriptional regulator
MAVAATRPETVPFVGRQAERRQIDRLLQCPRRGRSGTLLVRGEAGIGKTALLRYAIGRAKGMSVLHAQGVASESDLPYAGLSELLRPLLDRIELLPGPQASALAGALAVGPPVKADRFAASVATLNLVSIAAESEPILVVVDDLHWLDPASAEALVFAARRLNGEPVALLFAIREGEPTSIDVSGLPELVLEGLDREASLALLAAQGPAEIAVEVAERLVATTAGNPLALIEIPSLLSDDQRSGRAGLEDPLPAGLGIDRAFSRRLAQLPAETRMALLVAAASDASRLETVLYALGELGVDPVALEPAEAAQLVTIQDLRLEFRHPLLRSSVYSNASSPERRAVHRALAAAHAASAAEDALERRAWHLSAAAIGPDGEAAEALARAGGRARERHAYVATARAYERAARLSPQPAQAAEWLLAAAEAWRLLNHLPEAAALLDEADRLPAEGLTPLRVRHLRAKIDTWRGPAAAAHESLIRDAEELYGRAPEEAAAMAAEAVLCAIVAGDIRLAVASARRAYALARPLGGRPELLAALQLAKALILSGEGRDGHTLLMRCSELLDDADPLEHADELSQCAPVLMTVEEFEITDRVLARVGEAARAANMLGLFPYCLGALAELDLRLGRWTSSYANGLASVELAREAGQQGQLSYNLARLARLEAVQGREEACRAHAGEALELAERLRFGSTFPFAHAALGVLELGIGNSGEAIGRLEEARRWTDVVMGMFEPGRVEWGPDLVEAYVHAGRTEDAHDLTADLERRAENGATTWARAAAARCRGLVARDDDYDLSFTTALEWHDRTPTPFERARTELCFGERLRRTRKRAEARVPLRSAFETFERLGAAPWSRRAQVELNATGFTVRSRQVRFSDELTAQELQVALLVAKGLTNKEAGAALFLTPKTIEFHLGKIYRKLGVRSRTQLARRFGGEEGPSPSSPRLTAGPLA